MGAQGRLLSHLKRTPNSESIHQAAKGVRVEIKNGARASGATDHPPCSREHSQNVLALYFFE